MIKSLFHPRRKGNVEDTITKNRIRKSNRKKFTITTYYARAT